MTMLMTRTPGRSAATKNETVATKMKPSLGRLDRSTRAAAKWCAHKRYITRPTDPQLRG